MDALARTRARALYARMRAAQTAVNLVDQAQARLDHYREHRYNAWVLAGVAWERHLGMTGRSPDAFFLAPDRGPHLSWDPCTCVGGETAHEPGYRD